jgi:preprotein translocase subunit SecG
MRRSRRGLAGGGHEFGGSGEDSFVAVVVTKLTGALLFILLLTMVIMALIPKADEAAAKAKAKAGEAASALPLRVVTPEGLPEAIAGHPYAVALAAEGGTGARRWSVIGALPEGLTLDADAGLIHGTPKAGTAEPAALVVRVDDGTNRAAANARLVVYQSDSPLTTPSRWRPGLPPVPWRAWMEQGFGFLVLMLVHLVGMNTLAGLERLATNPEKPGRIGRFAMYRMVLRLASATATVGLAVWIWRGRLG